MRLDFRPTLQRDIMLEEPKHYPKKRLLIIGHGRHGKDTVAEFLNQLYGYNFESSSMAAARIFLYDALKDVYRYSSFEECYNDRANHRDEWHDLICEYNKDDKARLAKEILATSNIYVGMRSDEELEECKRQKLFDLVIGVFNPREPEEPSTSFNIDVWNQSDIIIPNANNLENLIKKLIKLKPLFT